MRWVLPWKGSQLSTCTDHWIFDKEYTWNRTSFCHLANPAQAPTSQVKPPGREAGVGTTVRCSDNKSASTTQVGPHSFPYAAPDVRQTGIISFYLTCTEQPAHTMGTEHPAHLPHHPFSRDSVSRLFSPNHKSDLGSLPCYAYSRHLSPPHQCQPPGQSHQDWYPKAFQTCLKNVMKPSSYNPAS